jgi:hypothetical protein
MKKGSLQIEANMIKLQRIHENEIKMYVFNNRGSRIMGYSNVSPKSNIHHDHAILLQKNGVVAIGFL